MEDSGIGKYKHNLSQELKEKWIKALEQEDYNQQIQTLGSCDNKSACALGVLVYVGGYLSKDDPNYFVKKGHEANPRVGYDIVQTMGLPTMLYERIYQLNDMVGMTFKEIAAWIRKNLE